MILVHDVRESTDTYMMYDPIFTVHTTRTSVTLIFYIYDKPIGPAARVSVNNCSLLFFYY